MKKYFHILKDSFIESIVLSKNHPEIYIFCAFIYLLATVQPKLATMLPSNIQIIIQYAIFLVYLSFSMSIPKLLLNREPSFKKNLRIIDLEIRNNAYRLFLLSLILFTGVRFMDRTEYVQSYMDSRSHFYLIFINSYYQFVILLTAVYFSVRRIPFAQSVIDSLAFTFTHVKFAVIMIIILIPFMWIKPMFLLTFTDFLSTLLSQFGMIVLTAWILAFMKLQKIDLSVVEKKHELMHPSGYGYAGNVRRIGAIIIDSIIFLILTVIIPLLLFPFNEILQRSLSFNIWLYVFSFMLYFVLNGYLLHGRSTGKLLTKIQIRHTDGSEVSLATILLRSGILTIEVCAILLIPFINTNSPYFIFEFIFCTVMFSGAFWSVFTRNKQSMHDMLAGTVVLKK